MSLGKRKAGAATVGVKRQYVGCAGKITNALCHVQLGVRAAHVGEQVAAAGVGGRTVL